MTYIQVKGKCSEIEDASYERTVTRKGQKSTEVVKKWTIKLLQPGSTEPMQFDVGEDIAPDSATLEKWELDETWVVVEADQMRRLVGSNEESGKAWAIVSFPATAIREMDAKEKQQMQEARKATLQQRKARKLQAKQAKAAEATKDEKAA
jgi:hypothetical protein